MLKWIERTRTFGRSISTRGLAPLRVVYEQFVTSLETSLFRIFEFLEVTTPPGFRFPAPTLSRQADELSENWVRQYVQPA